MLILFSSSNGEENYSVQSNLIVERLPKNRKKYNQFIFSWSFEKLDEMDVYKINLNLQYLA
jgi:hypothetical protein